jgi:hypothetical protein
MAAEEGRERKPRPQSKPFTASREEAARAWAEIATALRVSTKPADLSLARNIERFVIGRTLNRDLMSEPTRPPTEPQRDTGRSR